MKINLNFGVKEERKFKEHDIENRSAEVKKAIDTLKTSTKRTWPRKETQAEKDYQAKRDQRADGCDAVLN